MSELSDIAPVDGVIAAIFLVAVARGMWIGLIREGFSIAALGAAVIAVRLWRAPVAQWLEPSLGGFAEWIGGAALAVAAIAAVAITGRVVRRGAQAAGLGWADRLGGGALGLAEGALVVAVLLTVADWTVGRDHPALADSRSIEALAQAQQFVAARSSALPDVAAPPR